MSAACLVCALIVGGASAGAVAQPNIPDPTRPPQSAASQETEAGREAKGAKPQPRLQSVLISPRRKLAVIDGRTVRLGGEIDGARVVAITEGSVTLRRGAETYTLSLYPAVAKRAIAQ
jgi:MSHA biogenesis protein MshK